MNNTHQQYASLAPQPAGARKEGGILYACAGKGKNLYRLIGEAKGAGTSRGSLVMVYQSISTGELFYRQPDDFNIRMVDTGKRESPVKVPSHILLMMREYNLPWVAFYCYEHEQYYTDFDPLFPYHLEFCRCPACP